MDENDDYYLTVGELLRHIRKNKIPNSAKILIERIEDHYFENNNWTTIDKKNDLYHRAIEWNRAVNEDLKLDESEYDMTREKLINSKFSDEQIDELRSKYIKAWSPVKYSDDDDLYLDAHY